MPYSLLSHLECSRCAKPYDADVSQNLCPVEGAPLLARYDLTAVRAAVSREEIATRPPDLWRYRELLPVTDRTAVTTLGEGCTPLVGLPAYGASIGVPRLIMKDEGLLPTGTFKARGAAVGVSRARELGVTRIAMPTNGNAGSAWAAYAARAGIAATIVMPADAPDITRRECVAAGAQVFLVDGLIGDAGRMVGELVARSDGAVFDASTLKEPYRIEGKKTIGLEIAEQLGWRCPDVIVYPTGGGVGLIGIWKALAELVELGWLSGPLPRLVAVQSTGCAPIVAAYEAGAPESEPWPNARTVAFGITVAKALGDFLVLDAVRDSGGTAVAVTDAALLAELRTAARVEGTWLCPEGAACLAAVRDLRAGGWLAANDEVVVINTGTGLKYPETVPVDPPLLARDAVLP